MENLEESKHKEQRDKSRLNNDTSKYDDSSIWNIDEMSYYAKSKRSI